MSGEKREGLKRRFEPWQIIALFLMLYDLVAVHFSYFLALWVRFDCVYSRIPDRYLTWFIRFITPYSLVCVAIFFFFRMYKSIWRYASYSELMHTFAGSFTVSLLHTILITVLCGRMPASYYLWGAILQFFMLLLPRFLHRVLLLEKASLAQRKNAEKDKVIIIGAGSAGRMILRDIRNTSELNDTVVCFIDDDRNKWGRTIDGVTVIGGRDDILSAVEKYKADKIYLAIPSASLEDKKDILNICNETECELKQLPGMYQFMAGNISVRAMKDVSVEDLLGRDPIKADMEQVYNFIQGKVVMVTGGGGSIGSELCRQIAAHNPKQLIIFDVYENNAYAIQLELRDKYPDLNLEVLIGSVRDSRRMLDVFETYHPQIVYHAAAHKHVPLMEDSPNEAIKNNAIGTYKTAYAAMTHGCERFVLISTDKAVNPTNIMGASKRLCEMIIQSFDAKIKEGKAEEMPPLFTHAGTDEAFTKINFKDIKTEFVAVRFGNVLGSNGSVIPIFKRQIEQGGPVTVTHPDIIRYFMTIPEAVSLVMLAGTFAGGGEVYILDMGSPVKIDSLARNLIKLSGYKPDVDIKIEYTGLRPGEKLYEEKLMAEEGLRKTNNDLIHIGNPIPFDTDTFLSQLKILMNSSYANSKRIRELVETIVTTYHPEGVGEKNLEYTKQIQLIREDDE